MPAVPSSGTADGVRPVVGGDAGRGGVGDDGGSSDTGSGTAMPAGAASLARVSACWVTTNAAAARAHALSASTRRPAWSWARSCGTGKEKRSCRDSTGKRSCRDSIGRSVSDTGSGAFVRSVGDGADDSSEGNTSSISGSVSGRGDSFAAGLPAPRSESVPRSDSDKNPKGSTCVTPGLGAASPCRLPPALVSAEPLPCRPSSVTEVLCPQN